MKRLVLAMVAVALLAGCTGSPVASQSSGAPSGGAATPSFTMATLPRIDGSTANIPLISLVMQRLTGASATEADNAIKTTGTPNAYLHLVDGSTDLLLVYEADVDTLKEIKDSGVKLESHPIGRDALVFFTNASNPVTSLTTEQYRDIYTGKITGWSAVGGSDQKIVAYQRPEASGSQALMRKYVMHEAKMAPAPKEMVTAEMGEIIDRVSSYSNTGNALGYSVYYYLANMYATPGIKMLGVGGVQPSKETIASGDYPYGNDFFVVIRADETENSPARKVMNWMLTADGTQAVTDAGYVPLKK
ncbi:MAG: substrate-binding domain-containing protein [Propionibacteriales bacterium]|nr:substrate-binding domain-containing protein [Propionibacteriales bacterium]